MRRTGRSTSGSSPTLGIGFVFFLHGAGLSPQALKAGAAAWRLHLLVHASTFILFPAIGAALFFGTRGLLAPEVRMGFFYLCALSSTISSSVAMTALGRGNVPGAIFDATLSGLIGMIATPLLVSLVATTATGHLPLLPAILDVAKTLLLPLLLGQIARRWIGDLVRRNKPWTTRADRGVILLIVYSAFCESTAAGPVVALRSVADRADRDPRRRAARGGAGGDDARRARSLVQPGG